MPFLVAAVVILIPLIVAAVVIGDVLPPCAVDVVSSALGQHSIAYNDKSHCCLGQTNPWQLNILARMIIYSSI